MAKALPTTEYLRECFDYDSLTGTLIWKTRPLHHFKQKRDQTALNAKFAGKNAGCVYGTHGYLATRISNRQIDVHRVIWCMVKGYWPKMIDHRNGDGGDNRLENLREATHQQNGWNKPHAGKLPRGITLTAYNSYRVTVRNRGAYVFTRCYRTLEEAEAAWTAFARKQRGEFFHP